MIISDARKRDRRPEDQVMDELFALFQERMLFKERYDAAIKKASELGLSNRIIGAQLGVSEAAIRMYKKRNTL